MTKTCAWCKFFYMNVPQWAIQQGYTPATEECWVDGETTTQRSSCEAFTLTEFRHHFEEEVAQISAHEKAELLRRKEATYHAVLGSAPVMGAPRLIPTIKELKRRRGPHANRR